MASLRELAFGASKKATEKKHMKRTHTTHEDNLRSARDNQISGPKAIPTTRGNLSSVVPEAPHPPPDEAIQRKKIPTLHLKHGLQAVFRGGIFPQGQVNLRPHPDFRRGITSWWWYIEVRAGVSERKRGGGYV